jgi:hypothetical protein
MLEIGLIASLRYETVVRMNKRVARATDIP